MAERYWFRAQHKRIGWVPSTWQGWLVILFYIGLLIHSFLQIDSQSHSVSDTVINFLPRLLMFSAILIIITYLKGEPTTWSHGRSLKDTDKNADER